MDERYLTNMLAAAITWHPRIYEEVMPISARMVALKDGTSLIQACSTQYLAALWDGRVIEAIKRVTESSAASHWGSAGSNYLGGTHRARICLEEYFAALCGTEAGIACASGWVANYVIGETLKQTCDVIVSDARSHNSVIHGLRGHGARIIVADTSSPELSDELASHSGGTIAVLSPTIDGISGDVVTPRLPVRADIMTIRDECHSFGAVGATGVEVPGDARPDVRVVGLSKACSLTGAIVCGPRAFLDAIAQLGSPWMFSTAVPPIVWDVAIAVVPVICQMDDERSSILEMARRFRRLLCDAQIAHSGQLHITGVFMADDEATTFEDQMRRRGFYVKVSQFPTRRRGQSCARVCFTPHHTMNDVELIAGATAEALRAAGG